MARDPYALLGVSPGTDLAIVKKRYRRLAMKYHPDRAGSDPKKRALYEKRMSSYNNAFAEIQEASAFSSKVPPRNARRSASRAAESAGRGAARPRGEFGIFMRSAHLWARAGINHFAQTRIPFLRQTLLTSVGAARFFAAALVVALGVRLLTLRDFNFLTAAPDMYTGGPAKFLLRSLTVDAGEPTAAAAAARAVVVCKLGAAPVAPAVREDLSWVRRHWNDAAAISRVVLACQPSKPPTDPAAAGTADRFDAWWREAIQVIGAGTAGLMARTAYTSNPAVAAAAAEGAARSVAFTTRIPMGCADVAHSVAAASAAASGTVAAPSAAGRRSTSPSPKAKAGTAAAKTAAAGAASATVERDHAGGPGVLKASAPVVSPAAATRGRGVWAVEERGPLSLAGVLQGPAVRLPRDAMGSAWEHVLAAYRRVDGAAERRGDHEHAAAVAAAR